MVNNTVLSRLDALVCQNCAFVIFRLPKSEALVLYFQNNATIHTLNDLTSNGFVMTSFEGVKPILFIPDTYTEVFSRPDQCPKADPILLEKKAEAREDFIFRVKTAKIAIENGKFQKVVLSRTVKGNTSSTPQQLFLRLEKQYPEAMVYLFHHPKVGVWLGASPEQMIATNENSYTTMALAGTKLKQETAPRWTDKEIEEQALVVQQIEHVLNQYFKPHEIKKSKTNNLEAGHLVHLCTLFSFPKKSSVLDALIHQLHPTPAVGGMPKHEALKFIRQNEGYTREFYTGYFGPISNESVQLFVNLRCAQWFSDAVLLYVGAGITQGSDPDQEWEETERKARTLGGE